MKKTVKTTKKALSLFLSLLMMLTTLVAAIPGVVSAAEISEETVMYNSGIGVQFLDMADNAIDGVYVNHEYISTNNDVNTVHTFVPTGFDTVKIRLNNMDGKYPVTVLSVVADKAYIGATETADTSSYNTATTIAAGNYKDLYIVSPSDFNEGGNITYTITYQVDGGKITNICGGNTFTAKAYLYVNPAEEIRHGLHEGINIEEHPTHVSDEQLLSFWYYLEASKGFITNYKLNSAEKFLDDMTVTDDTEKNYDGRDNYRTFDFAEACHKDALVDSSNNKPYNNGQCIGTYRCYSDGHIVTYNYYYDVTEVDSFEDAGFRTRLQENYLSCWNIGVNLKYLRLAADQNYLDGIKGDDKTFTVSFVPFSTGTQNVKAYSSSGLAQVDDINVDTSVLIDGPQNKWGNPYDDAYVNFSGELPTDTGKTGKIMFSPKFNMQFSRMSASGGNTVVTTYEDSSFMTTHINLIPYDKSELRTAVTAAEQTGYCSGYYFDTTKGIAGTTYEAYENALAAAKAVLGMGATTQADIDAALAELNTAVAGLKELEHNWGETTYTWNAEYTECTATRHCPNEGGHDEIAKATISKAETAGTCVDKATTTYTATFTDSWAEEQIKTVEGELGEHDWAKDIVYEWNEDYTKCTATKVCLNDASHNLVSVGKVTSNTVPGTCVDNAQTTYTATFTDTWAEEQTKVVDGELGEHDWAEDILYEWKEIDGEWTCTATKVCNTDEDHNLVSVGTVTSATVPGTCVDKAQTTYTATFTDTWAEEQTKTVEGDKADHNWIKIEYTWNEDNTECTATRTCDKGHTETVKTTNITSTVVTDPTCADEGTKTYTATFEADSWASTQTKEEKIPVSDHIWEKIEYTWNDDNTECTVTRTCTKGHKESETVKTTTATTPAECEKPGETKYTADFTVDWAVDQEKTVEIPATEHNWGEPTYTWNADNTECTATRVCLNDPDHIKKETVTAVVTTTAGSCKEKATTTYTATFADGTKKTVTVEGEFGEHNWADELIYTWSEDKTTCTATKVCKTDASHNVSETVTAVVTSTAGTCKEKGTTTYTATFADGTVKTVTVEGELGEHDWADELVYTWSADNKTCTATKVCKTDASHNVEETVTAVVTTTAGTCKEKGTTTYTATFADGTVKTVTVEGELGEHDWADELVYTWSEDKTTCTATKVCETDSSHNVSETVTAVVTSTAGTCKENGTTTYTATFADGTVKTVTVEGALGEHDWADELVYTWSEDKTTCTATKVCNTDASHNVSETVTAVITSTAGTCKEEATTTYTATFADGTVQTVTVEGELGDHIWIKDENGNIKVDYKWSSDYSKCTATITCTNGHTKSETVDTTLDIKVPDCENDGAAEFTATFESDWAETQYMTDPISAKGHDWGKPTYTWNEDNTVCTATRVCKNDPTHVQTETKEAVIVKNDPTCQQEGEITYTADFEADWAETQTKEESIPALPHEWTVTYEWSEDNKTCTATAECANGHTEKETVTVVVTEIAPNCVEYGKTVYTAGFKSDWANAQVKEFIGNTYGDHVWNEGVITRPIQNEDGTWTDGRIDYTCEKDSSHTKYETVKRADYTEYDAAVEKLEELLKDEALKDSAREKIEKALADNAVPDNLIVPEQDLINAPAVTLDKLYNSISGDKDSFTYNSVVFGKTNGIGWYKVSEDGGKNYKTVFGNSTYEVKKGTELWISVGDIMGNSFTFYVNGDAMKPDENGILKIKVNGYMLIGALGFEIETPEDPGAPDVPDVEESLNWFQKIIKAIKDFFEWIGSWFK